MFSRSSGPWLVRQVGGAELKAFDYRAPSSVEEAVGLLAEAGGRARPLAGGTDIIVQMRVGRIEPDYLIDVKQISELNELSFDPARGLTIGAAVPCYRVYEHPQIQAVYPGLVDSASIIGGIGIQGRATLGGNLCNAAPSADAIPSLIVAGANCLIGSTAGRRTIPVEELCIAPGRTSLAPGELLISISIPRPPSRSGSRYLRFIPRNEMDIAVAGAGAFVGLSADGTQIEQARIALSAVAPTPLLAEEAGRYLIGRTVSDEAIAAAADLAAQAARPITDMRGTAEQRRHLVRVLVQRALEGAIKRAQSAPAANGDGHLANQ